MLVCGQGFKTLDSIFPPGSEGRPPNWKPEPPKTPPSPPGDSAHDVAPLSTSDPMAQGKSGKGLHDHLGSGLHSCDRTLSDDLVRTGRGSPWSTKQPSAAEIEQSRATYEPCTRTPAL